MERIDQKNEYIPNDFSLGTKKLGTIIYGLNTSGKSTLVKAIGSAIVLAQAGMFVPASFLAFSPFRTILSKLSITDNLYKGQSTFVVELSEIRTMLNRADRFTLVLSDELCSSTESLSGHAIVASTLSLLVKRKARFVFTTHLQSLQELSLIKDNDKINIMHFQVRIEKGEIIYDRKLQDGGLNELYGLEIAKNFGLHDEFNRLAVSVRNKLAKKQPEILATKTSRYNKEVYVHNCAFCGSIEKLETHHLKFQCTADSNDLIEKRFHKHKKFNLIVVCKECHVSIHQKKV